MRAVARVVLVGAASAGVVLTAGALSSVHWAGEKLSVSRALVDRHLASGPRGHGHVWSAPCTLAPGQWLDVDLLADDLVVSGWSTGLPPAGASCEPRVAVLEDTLALFRCDPRRTDLVTLRDGRVLAVAPGPTVELPPLLLDRTEPQGARRSGDALSGVSGWMELALVAAEDTRFYEHPGVDPVGIARAASTNARAGTVVQGGSTLTQQLAKNVLLTPDRTFSRKVDEAFAAVALEQALDKREILAMYLRETYFGSVDGVPLVGIRDASLGYFGVPASDLDLAQAATLAAILPAPNRYSPVRHPETARERRDLVLRRMGELGTVDAATLERALAEPLTTRPVLLARRTRAPWAVARARAEGAGLSEVYTTIDPMRQGAAEAAVRGQVAALREETGRPDLEGASVTLRLSDGAVLALVGGVDFDVSEFDRATAARRQVGSLVKPFTLAAALRSGRLRSPLDTLHDAPVAVWDGREWWTPANYTHDWEGDLTARRALEHSRNAPFVDLARRVGFEAVQDELVGAGLKGAHGYPSVALGAFPATPLEMAGAYLPFGTGGVARQPTLLAGDHGTGTRVMDPEVAGMVLDALRGVTWRGTAARLRRGDRFDGLDLAGKTGTTDDGRDSWYVGMDAETVTVTWVGADAGAPVGLTGARGALRIYADQLDRLPLQDASFALPDGLVRAVACAEGYVPADGCCEDGRYAEVFVRGRVPAPTCPDTEEEGLLVAEAGPAEREPVERAEREPDGAPRSAGRRRSSRP